MNNTQETALITISSLPEIRENLLALKERWEQLAADAAAMVCTEDTVQDLKNIRAETTKEFKAADAQRLAVKKQYMAPWDAIEATFKECVKDAYTRADKALKDQIDGFENELKERCRADLEAYYEDFAATCNVDFLTFDQAMTLGNVKISLADAKRVTPKQAQDALARVIHKVASDVTMIQSMDDAAQIMVEYRKCFDVGRAAAAVQERKRQEQAEKEAAEQRRIVQEAQAAARAKVEAALPARPVMAPVKQEKSPDDIIPELTFTIVGATRAQLLKLRDYLKQEGLQYR